MHDRDQRGRRGTKAVTDSAASTGILVQAPRLYNESNYDRQRNNTQFVTDMYYSFLRRGGDLAGVQFWINQLNTGAKTTIENLDEGESLS